MSSLDNGKEKAAGKDKDREKEMITLVSAEGTKFSVTKDAAMQSGTIRRLLTGPGVFMEQEIGELPFREIKGPVLKKVIEYFEYKLKYTNSVDDIPEFEIDPELALELLMAANFLEV